MSGPEAKLEAACVKYAKSKGWLHAKLDPKGNVGVPDHVFFGHGLFVPKTRVVEFKIGDNSPTPKQDAWAVKFSKLCQVPGREGSRVRVIRTLEEFKELIG